MTVAEELIASTEQSTRHLPSDPPWIWRAPLMAAICAAAGLLIWNLVGNVEELNSRWAGALAAAAAVATLGFVLTVEMRRWSWAAAFALGWGVTIGLIAYWTSGYGRVGTIFEWPFFAGVLAVLLAAPLFQGARDAGSLRLQPAEATRHLWIDAVIGTTSLLFVGLTFLMTALVAGLFDVIGLDFLKELMNEGWFAWMLAGAAFGGAVGVLRERDALVDTMLRLALIILSVLAPVLAAALLLFLLSLPLAGLGGLWDGWISAAALTLAAGSGALLFANAALGSSTERSGGGSRLFDWSARALVACILPLAALATLAMSLRIGQYGWTPERIWGVLAAAVSLTMGAAGWFALIRHWSDFGAVLQKLQAWVAAGVCGIALFLALPIVDFGAIATRDQLARLTSGAVPAAEFDWAAMAFDFGPSGRAALQQLARSSSNADVQRRARAALAVEGRYAVEDEVGQADRVANLQQRLRQTGVRLPLDATLRQAIGQSSFCDSESCTLHGLDTNRAVLHESNGRRLRVLALVRQRDGSWRQEWMSRPADVPEADGAPEVAVQPVTREDLRIDGVSWGLLPERQ